VFVFSVVGFVSTGLPFMIILALFGFILTLFCLAKLLTTTVNIHDDSKLEKFLNE